MIQVKVEICKNIALNVFVKMCQKGVLGYYPIGSGESPDRARDEFENKCFCDDARWRRARSLDRASSRPTTGRVSPDRARKKLRISKIQPDRADVARLDWAGAR